MTDLLQTGSFARAVTTTAPKQAVIAPPAWRFLWLQADAGNQSPLNVWIGVAPGNRPPDFTLGPGQQREQDMGTASSYSWWVQSSDLSAWGAAYALDVQPVGTNANVVGATTPLQPARSVGTYQTTNNVDVLSGPYPVQANQQGVILQYPLNSNGPQNLRLRGNDGSVSATQVPAIGFGPNTFVLLFPDGMGATTYQVEHNDSDIAPQTVKVGAFFTTLQQLVVAQQGYGYGEQNAWDFRFAGSAPGAGSLPVTAGATFPVSQSGGWSVAQSGAPWSVNVADQVSGLSIADFQVTDVLSPTTIIAAPGAPLVITLYAYDVTLDINGAVTPCNGNAALQGHASGKRLARWWYEAQSTAGKLTDPHALALPRPVQLPQTEGLDVVWSSVANHVQVTGAVHYTTKALGA